MPDIAFVKEQFNQWSTEFRQTNLSALTKSITHGDVGPKDFFFENGEFTGIMDFNAAEPGYLLSDIVSMMMYCEIFRPNRIDYFQIFMKNYLKTAPILVDELKWLHLLLKARWFLQIFYHQYRYQERIVQGLDSESNEENLVGVNDGIEFLKVTNQFPRNYFYRLLIKYIDKKQQD
jgi:Ser/Thr protein kinase RdoA (MazF antagonist)